MSSLLSALKKKKTPEQLVRAACAAMAEGNAASLSKRLVAMKEVLYGEEDKEPVEAKCKELSAALRGAGLMPQLIEAMPVLPFEARKDVAQVFNNLVRKNHEGFADYVAENPTMVKDLILAYGNPDIAILCGSMLRECIRYESLARATLADDMLWLFFDSYVHLPNFDVASDAFATLRDLLTRNKAAASEFLSERFDTVFSKYTILLDSENYVTRRQSLKLLGELLLDRSNFAVMMRYICNRDNLKKMMMLLRDKSPNIQYEAFHVFKVFVANPKKPPEITRILVANRAKLITYLENFHNDKDDEQSQQQHQRSCGGTGNSQQCVKRQA
eukprot:TRINITY_DN12413_c0_g1_i4.p1 TRINITY_DN12413_c0_g1~~TRINITY_DN12413_c0_g1_i4.p1  ORF type:complete len:329 (+),score=137.67 TRINITY_DN12413_c0_g1_i4:121-1107(+)